MDNRTIFIKKIAISIAIFIYFLQIFIPLSVMAEQQQIAIKVRSLNVRKGPGASNPVISTVKINEKYSVLDQKKRWIKIQLNSKKTGWVSSKYVEFVKNKTSPAIKSKAKNKRVSETRSNEESSTRTFKGFLLIGALLLAIFLWPSSSKSKKNIHKGAKTTGKFNFPVKSDIYKNNSFQVLGLIPHKSDARSIAKRKNELAVLIKADLSPEEHIKEGYYSISWSEEAPLTPLITESSLSKAYAQLQDPTKRVKEELFWFHLEEDKMEPFACLSKGDLKKGQELLEKEIKDNPKNYAGGIAKHNLAVLMHACTLNQEKNISSNPGMDGKQIANWVKNFTLWKEVCKDDKCWQYFMQRIVYLNDPRINKRYINNLRRELPQLVLRPNLEIACAALEQGMLKYAKQHFDLIRNSGFDSKDTFSVEKEFFTIFLVELKAVIDEFKNYTDSTSVKRIKRCEKYEFFLEKVVTVTDSVGFFEGYEYIKGEIEKFGSLAGEAIKKDFNRELDKVIAISDDINKKANSIIEAWNNQSSYSSHCNSIRENFEKNAAKIVDLKKAVKEAINFATEVSRLFKMMEKLCLDDENKKYVSKDIEWTNRQKTELRKFVSPVEDYINRNLNAMRGY